MGHATLRRRLALVLAAAMAVLGLTAGVSPRPAAAQTPEPNPVLPNTCGLKFALVFDLSVSIEQTHLVEMQNAANSVVTALTGTPSSIGIYTFGTYAPAFSSATSTTPAGNASLAATSVATADEATTVHDHINGLTRAIPTTAGYTNWQQGLLQTTETNSGVKYDAVLFVTDGVPTANGGRLSGNAVSLSPNPAAATPRAADLNPAIDAANTLKRVGTRVIAIGVTGATTSTLQQVSGTQQNSDWFLTSFEGLGQALKDATLETCQGSVTVIKEVRAIDGSQTTAEGWHFSASASDDAALDPTEGETGANGAINFVVSETTNVTVTETEQAGYRLAPQDGSNAVCTVNGESAGGYANGPPGLFTVHVPVTDIVSCTVVNEQIGARLTLVKHVSNISGNAQPDDWTLHATGPSTISGPSGSVEVTSAPVLAGTYTLSESGGPEGPPDTPAYTPGTWDCTGPGVSHAAGSAQVALANDADGTCSITNSEVGVVQLRQDKTVDEAEAVTGNTLTYTMTVGNIGNVASDAFTATDTLPTTGVTFVSATPSVGVFDETTGIWTISAPGLAPGDTATLTITVTVTAAPAAGDMTTLTNMFLVHPPDGAEPTEVENPCPDPNADQSCAETVVRGPEPSPQLSISKTVDESTAAVGDNLTYTVEVVNTGNTTETDFTVTDTLPPDVTFVDATPSTGTATPNADSTAITWTIPSLAPEAHATMTITVTVSAGAEASTQTNGATLTPPPGVPVEVDPDTACPRGVDDQVCAETVIPGVPHLTQNKRVDMATAVAGDRLTYTMTVGNTGTGDAVDVVAHDSLPPNVTFVRATPSQGAFDETTGSWTIGTITPGQTVTLAIIVTVESEAEATTLVNRFQVEQPPSGGEDITVESPCPDDDTESCAETVVPGVPRLTQSKVVDAQEAPVGARLTYVMTVTNNGTGPADNSVAHDTLPPGVTFVSDTASQGTFDSSTGTWTIGTITPGQTVTLTIIVTVNPGTEGTTLTNSFIVERPPSGPPPIVEQPCVDQPDHSCSTTDVPGVAQLEQAKSANKQAAMVGDTVTYTITITNRGTGDADNAIVHDLLPPGLSLVSANTFGQGTFDASTGTWVTPVPAGATFMLVLVVTIQPSAAGQMLTNRLMVTAPPGSGGNIVEDPCPGDPADSCATVDVELAPPAPVSPIVPPVQVTG